MHFTFSWLAMPHSLYVGNLFSILLCDSIKVFGLYLLGPYAVLTCAVLIPLAVTSHGHLQGVDLLTFGHISPDQFTRHTACYLIAIVLICALSFFLSPHPCRIEHPSKDFNPSIQIPLSIND